MAVSSSYFKYIIACIIVVVFWSCFLTAEPGWGDDFAMYIIHAINLSEGMPYADMGFIHSEIHYWSTPIASTPGLPVLFALLYSFFGLNIVVFKIAQLISIVIGVTLIFFYLSRYTSKQVALFASGCFLFNPFLVDMTQAIATELLFIPLSIAALLFVDLALPVRNLVKSASLMLVAGFFAYFAYSVRSIGIVIPISVLVYGLAVFPKRIWIVVPMWISFSMGYVGQSILFPEIYQKTELCIQCILPNGILYLRSLAGLFVFDDLPRSVMLPVSKVLSVSFILLSVIGALATKIKKISEITKVENGRGGGLANECLSFVIRCVQSLHLFDWYILATVSVVLLLDFSQAPRYLIPVLPFMFYYCGGGLVFIAKRFNLPVKFIVAAPILFFFGFFVVSIRTHMEPQITNESTQELFTYIKEELSADSVIAFVKPRALTLYTGKQTTLRPHKNATFGESIEYFSEVNVSHVLIAKPKSGLELEAWMVEIDILNRNLPVVMENDFFIVALIDPLYSMETVNGASL